MIVHALQHWLSAEVRGASTVSGLHALWGLLLMLLQDTICRLFAEEGTQTMARTAAVLNDCAVPACIHA